MLWKYIGTKISFAILRSIILCIRGCISLKHRVTQAKSSVSAFAEDGMYALNNLTTNNMAAIPPFYRRTSVLRFGVLFHKLVLHLPRFPNFPLRDRN